MVELLKQPQFSPLSVGAEVITILAGSSGLLDDVPVEATSRLATDLLGWLSQKHPDFAAEINQTGKLSDELATKITEHLAEFKTIYQETHS